MPSEKFIDFLKVCKCGKVYVNFHSVAAYVSVVMEFWKLTLEQRIKLFLTFLFFFLCIAEKTSFLHQNEKDVNRIVLPIFSD